MEKGFRTFRCPGTAEMECGSKQQFPVTAKDYGTTMHVRCKACKSISAIAIPTPPEPPKAADKSSKTIFDDLFGDMFKGAKK